MPLDDDTLELYRRIVESDARARTNTQEDLERAAARHRTAIYPAAAIGAVLYPGVPFVGIPAFAIGAYCGIRAFDEQRWSERLEPEYSKHSLLCYDPETVLVTMREDPAGFQVVRDARHFTDGFALDPRPSLVTDVEVERIGTQNWIGIANRGMKTMAPAGRYDWMIVECQGQRLNPLKKARL